MKLRNVEKNLLLMGILLVTFTVKSQISFTEIAGTTFPPLSNGEMEFADFDDDGDMDLLLSGEGEPFTGMDYTAMTLLYMNDGAGDFTLATGLSIDSLRSSSISTGDIDNDGDVDVFICGQDNNNNTVAQIYKNDGNAVFTLTGNNLIGTIQGDADFGDIDGDNDLDLILTGYTSSGYNTSLYKNDGSGSFTLVAGTSFSGTNNASVKFLDIENDNDLDVIIAGDNGGTPFTELYANDGNGTFSLVGGTPFDGALLGGIDATDVDNDGDIDILVAGYNGTTEFTKLYLNDGSGVYTLSTYSNFTGVAYASVQFGDVDLDNDMDLMISGYNGVTTSRYTILYENDGSGVFTEVGSMPFAPNQQYRNKFADIDGDNDLDFYLSGSSNGGGPDNAVMYRNNHCSAPITGTDTRTECSPYTWIDGVTYFSDNNTAQFTLTSASGCDSIVTLDLIIYTLSDLTTSVNGITISANNNNATYRWLDCDNNFSIISGETNQSFTPSVNGNYAVQLTENNCVDTSDCVAISTVGLNENDFGDLFKLYPNPSNGSFTIELGKDLKSSNISIRTVLGKTVYTSTLSGDKHKIQMFEDKGIYFVNIETEEGQFATLKLIVE